jgi:tetratricopeptide (TPR) repeat protein
LRLWPLLACGLVSCSSRQDSAIDGAVVLEEEVALERGTQHDSALRSYATPADGTVVAIVEENDFDVRVRIERTPSGDSSPSFVEVESVMLGVGIEVATLDVKAGNRLAIRFQSKHEFDHPGRVRLKLLRYDSASSREPATRARLQAFADWTAATLFDSAVEVSDQERLQRLDAALAHLQSADGDPYLAAWGRLARARFNYSLLNDYPPAVEDARKAARSFLALDDTRNAARAQFVAGSSLIEMLSSERATREGQEILRALATDPALSARERARSLGNLGYLEFETGRMLTADAWTTQALAAFRAIGDREGARMMLSNLAIIAYERGDLQTATRMYDELIPELAEFASLEQRFTSLYNAALVDVAAGNTDRGIERFLRLVQEAREQRRARHEARGLHGLGLAYRQRGDFTQAAALLEEARKGRVKTLDRPGEGLTLRAAGDIARELGDYESALAMHRQALALTPHHDLKLRTLAEIARDYAAMGDHERAIATARSALADHGAQTTPYRRLTTEMAIAESLLARRQRTPRDVSEATVLATQVLAGARDSADITLEQAARRILAQAHEASGRSTEARKEYEHAIALVFRYRSMTGSPEQRATTLARTEDMFRGYIDLLMHETAARGPARLLPAQAAEQDALRVLESARIINFNAVRVARVDASAQARIDALLVQMAGKRVRMAAMMDRAGEPGPELKQLQLDVARLRSEVDRERARGAVAAGAEGWAQELTQPWPTLPKDTTQLSYALGVRHAYLWIRDASGIRVTVLAQSPAAIDRELRRLTQLNRNASAGEAEKAYRKISRVLLPEGAITSGSTHLEIVAEGILASVPFALLAEAHSISMISSMFEGGVAKEPAAPRDSRLVAVWNDAAPLGAGQAKLFPALNSSRSEARSIAAMFARETAAPGIRLLTGEAAGARDIKAAWMRGADVFHFATHGLADLRQPMASLLQLPSKGPAGGNDYLTAGQVQEWRGDADLVYLSACETAVGPARFADGMPGLQRAFLRAGARGVIATLWPIEDVYAGQFAVDFYRRYTAGVPAVQALSETQREWARPAADVAASEQPHRRMTAWAHVYYTQ